MTLLALRRQFPSVPASPDFRRLLLAASISEFGDWATRLALAAFLLERTGDPAWVGLVAVAYVLPRLGVGQVLTSWSEGLARKPVLVTGDAARAAIFVIAGLTDVSPIVMLALVVLASTIDPVFEANASAAAFDLLDDDNRDDGVRLRQVTRMIAQVAGLGLGGVALQWMSPQTLLLVNSSTFALSAAIIAGSRVVHVAERSESVSRALSRAARFIAADLHIRAALTTTTLTAFAANAAEAQVVVFADDQPAWVLPAASASIPLFVIAVTAIGSTDGDTRTILRRSLALTAANAIGAMVALSSTNPVVVVIGFCCIGAMFRTVVVGQVVAVRRLPTDGRASALSLLQTVVLLGSAAGAATSGLAMNALGRERGIQLCLAVAFAALLIPLPRPASAATDGIEGVGR